MCQKLQILKQKNLRSNQNSISENRTAFLDSLKVYIEHTDGTQEAKGGTIIYENGNPIGLETTIDKFSSFQIFSVDQKKNSSTLVKTGSSLDLMTITLLGVLLILIGAGVLVFRKKD
jgi:LPXTG-motif cell wall-anchored protein